MNKPSKPDLYELILGEELATETSPKKSDNRNSCPDCERWGWISDPNGDKWSSQIPCPTCNASGWEPLDESLQ